MDETKKNNREVILMDVNSLTESELEELARKVVRKLRESMREEQDRSGR